MRMTRVLSVFLLFSAIPYYSGALDPPVRASSVQSWELAASNASVNASIGSSVAIGGDTVVVGSIGGGPVYVYEKPAGGWRNMLQTAELTPSTGGFGDTVVAISGDTIIVGSGLGGDVYVFVKPSGGWTNMTETARLSDGVTGDYFGISVAIDGSTIVVGATGTEVNGTQEQGAAYVFVEPPTGWATTSAFDAELTSSNGTYVDLFGVSVRVSGKTIVVGAPFDDDRTGPGAGPRRLHLQVARALREALWTKT